jgi:signal-transduction protein with cAMP-binding, CBS, and nucleotidyltransferase domain
MSQDQIRRLPVTDNGRIVGFLSLGDLARNRNCDMEASEALSEISANIKRR